jgi:hypothetical protein
VIDFTARLHLPQDSFTPPVEDNVDGLPGGGATTSFKACHNAFGRAQRARLPTRR